MNGGTTSCWLSWEGHALWDAWVVFKKSGDSEVTCGEMTQRQREMPGEAQLLHPPSSESSQPGHMARGE